MVAMVMWAPGDTYNHMLLTSISSLVKVDHRLEEEEEADEDVSLAPSVKVLFVRGGLGWETATALPTNTCITFSSYCITFSFSCITLCSSPLLPSFQHFYQDLSSLDIRSPSFAALPPEIQHELIAEKQRHDKEIKFRHLEEVPKVGMRHCRLTIPLLPVSAFMTCVPISKCF